MGILGRSNMAPKKKPEEEEEVEEDPGPPPVEEGNGVFIFPDSTKFDGQWQKGGELGEDFRRHGQGTHIVGCMARANTSTKRVSPGKAASTTVSDRDLAQLYDRGAFCHIRLHCLLRSDRTNPRTNPRII